MVLGRRLLKLLGVVIIESFLGKWLDYWLE